MDFQSENLVVDWISFNIRGLIDPKSIATYLSESFSFNSTIKKDFKGKFESLISNVGNQYKVSFRQYDYDPQVKSFWSGTKMILSGENATQFYSEIKKHRFNWDIFGVQKTSLSRFDLYYLREPESTDQSYQLELFMEECYQKIHAKSKRRYASWHWNSKGLLLKIGSRSSSNYYRVYEKNHGLEFELEMKNKVVRSFQGLLFSNCFEEFENELSNRFYQCSKNSLILNTYYTDWLANRLRKISEKQKSDHFLITDYLENSNLNSFIEREYLFRFFQLLSFIRRFKRFKQYIGDQSYYFIEFPVSDFLRFTNVAGVGGKRQYQLNKTLHFLFSLQKLDPIVEIFSDVSFKSYVTFPYLLVVKKGKSWVVRISVAKPLYDYNYPFFLPKNFLFYKDQYEMEVKLKLIQSFSIVGLEKNFSVEDFLNQFSIPNKKRTEIKKLIIDLLDELKNCKLIESKFKIINKNGSSTRVKQLTPLLLTKSKYICFHEIIDY